MSVQNQLKMHDISIQFSGFSALSHVNFALIGGTTHALTGANGAGKSTLMAVLAGTHGHYQGQISINNQHIAVTTPRQARQHGVHLVQQEVDVALVPGLSVAENIMLDQLAEAGFYHSWSKIRQQAHDALSQLGVTLNVEQSVDRCSLAEKQHILLARALTHECRFLILDEPTAPLDQHESERLFDVVRHLKTRGIGIVFISHRLNEIRDICDHVTILRDGKLIDSGRMADFTDALIVEKMLGHRIEDIYPPRRILEKADPLLQIAGLHDDQLLHDISFTLHRGEILGFAGLAGAGKTELCKALFGAASSRVQSAYLNGQRWHPHSPADSVRNGIALIPEERRKEGIFIEESITTNLSVVDDRDFSAFGIFNFRAAREWAQTLMQRLKVKATHSEQSLHHLSGGNQQKVAIGKWLKGQSDVVILDEPTKGVDIRTKADLFRLIENLAHEGKGIIYASGDFSELVGLCHRICILFDGRIVAEISGNDAKEELLLLYSTGGTPA